MITSPAITTIEDLVGFLLRHPQSIPYQTQLVQMKREADKRPSAPYLGIYAIESLIPVCFDLEQQEAIWPIVTAFRKEKKMSWASMSFYSTLPFEETEFLDSIASYLDIEDAQELIRIMMACQPPLEPQLIPLVAERRHPDEEGGYHVERYHLIDVCTDLKKITTAAGFKELQRVKTIWSSRPEIPWTVLAVVDQLVGEEGTTPPESEEYVFDQSTKEKDDRNTSREKEACV